MSIQGQPVTITYTAYNRATGALVGGDQANHTLKLVTDGVEATLAAVATPLSNGEYALALTGAQNNGASMSVTGASSTANVAIVTAKWMNSAATAATVVTFSQAAAAVGAPAPTQGNFAIVRGDTLSVSITGLGSLSGATKLWFTAKSMINDDADAAAVFQVEQTAGLTVIAGSAGTSTDGSLAIADATAGNILISVDAAASSQLPVGQFRYDVQIEVGAVIRTLASGVMIVLRDTTRAVA